MLISLQNLFNKEDLRIVYLEMDRTAFYYPKTHTVFLNVDLCDTTQENFAVAHELAHFIEGHAELNALYPSKFYHGKIEREANKLAIEILLGIFVENELTHESQFVLDRFMYFYSIPTRLRDLCFNVCSEFFNNQDIILA
ncbi:ImmA/IrrE family metallo-endopeptidase [Enterococcus faecium]|uniref:ImmA/IrrE family metallo-endopeptidase n=1 Tax=Enterococcus faecium TaxID=1352 RepID=UPI000BF1B72C|nr:ImmA/IrrE family metallo-endopeptidase [Enterococcus faecium]PEH49342.1 toxin [Enterococcus faecium]